MNSGDYVYDEAKAGNYSRNGAGTGEGYEDGHSQSPPSPGEPDTHESSQSPPISQHQSNVDYDDESQYSLSEFSHIHLDSENDQQNQTFGSLVHAGQFTKLLLPLTGPTTFSTDTSSVAGVADNATTSRKRAFSFAASTDGASSSAGGGTPMAGLANAAMGAISEGSSSSSSSNGNNNNHINNSNGFPSTEKQRTATKICRVCGDKAFSYNFNVITCESCKAFFRRNANKEKEIRCPFNDSCDINMVSRRFCQRCRLHKCFRVGMKKEWIMSEEARLEKKQRIHDNRQRRIAERKRRSGSAEAFSNAIKASTSSAAGGSTSNGQLVTSTTASDNANSDIAPPAEKFLNTDPAILIENSSNNALLTSTATATAGVAGSVDQPAPAPTLIDTKALAGLPTALQLSNVTKLAANATNSSGSSGLTSETVVIQPVMPTLPILPSLINNERRPSADILAAVVSNNLAQLNSAQQQQLQQQQQQQQQLFQQQQLQQQQQQQQFQQQQQQPQQQDQKLEPMDHEPSVTMSAQAIIPPAMDQQSFGALASQSQQPSAQQTAQMEQLSLIGIGINPTSITSTTSMCPTFCATNTNIPAGCISQSETSSQPSSLISAADATLAAAAAAAAVAASQPLILNSTASQPTANIAAVVQVAQLQNLEQQQQRLLHQQQQQHQAAAAAVIQQQLQNQQVIVVANQQQQLAQQHLLAAQQQHHQQQLEQQKLAAAVVSCLQPQAITTAVDIAAAAMAATQPTQTLNQPPDPSQFIDAAAAAAAAAAGMMPQTVSVVPSPPSALMTTIPPLQQLQQQQKQASLLPKLIESAAAAVSASHQRNSQEMVSVPKDVLIKLVEHKIESDQQQADAKPTKCQCRCQCGRYPSEMLIVDKVMTDLLDNSSKSCCESSRRNSVYHACGEHALSSAGGNGSTANTPPTYALTAAAQAGASAFYQSSPTAIKIQPPAGNTASAVGFEAAFNSSDLEINADYCKMALGDEENLQELLRANGIWNSEPGETQFGVTESGLRRLIRTISSFATFRSLDRHDQTLLLKHGCENYFALRGATSFNEEKIPLLVQNGVSENLIGFYRDFEIKYRSNETIILLLCMILLFNPDIPELNNRPLVAMESIKYQSILKRLLYALCGENIQEAAKTFMHLMAKLDQLKAIATICPLDSVEPIVQRVFDPSAIMSTTFNAIFQDANNTNTPTTASITTGPTTTITTGYV